MSPMLEFLLAEAGYWARGLPNDAPVLLRVLCPNVGCDGSLGLVHHTDDGPILIAVLRAEAPGSVPLRVVRLLRHPPPGRDELPLFVSCRGKCKARFVLQRHLVLVAAKSHDTRAYRPPARPATG